MNKVNNISLKPLIESIYLTPLRMDYVQNGKKKHWDLLKIHDSVAILIYNISRNVLIFVKQFRPPVYYGCITDENKKLSTIDPQKYPPNLGITLELCAGIVDKPTNLEQIAKEEVLEECGYDVPLSSLEKIASYRVSIGVSGALQTNYYCEVTDEMKVSGGGGVDDELIDIIEMNIDELKTYIKSDNLPSPPSFLFAIYWFLYHKGL